MPIDPSIPLQVKSFRLPDPVESYSRGLQLQNMAMQNEQAQRQYRMDLDTEEAFRQSGGDMAKASQLLMDRGLYKPAMAVQKQVTDQKTAQANLDKTTLDTLSKRLALIGGALADVSQTPTREAVLAKMSQLHQQGVPGMLEAAQSLPADDAQIPAWIRSQMMTTEQGRKALEAMQPKIEYKDTGGALLPVNVNLMAGPIGPANAPSLTKTNTPGELLTDERTRSEGAANRAVTMRGQNMVDARTRELQQRDRFGAPQEVTGPDGKPMLVVQNKNNGVFHDANTLEPVGRIGPKIGETAQKQLAGVSTVRDAISEYRSALKDLSTTDIANPNARARMGTIYNNMLLQAKEAYNLGVLNGPDYQILQEVITNPVSWKGAITSKKALDDQASKLDAIMQRIGQKVTQVQSGVNQPEAASSAPREFKTVSEAARAGLAPGTRVIINGRSGTWQ